MLQYLKKYSGVLLVALCLMPMEAPASAKLNINSLDAGSFPILKAIVTVEQDGIVLDRLTPSDFKVAIEGKGEVDVNRVVSLEESGENVAMVLAVDTSGSMKKNILMHQEIQLTNWISNTQRPGCDCLDSFNG